MKGIEKLATGIPGFDDFLGGGVPKNRALLVSGTAGTGKTVLLSSFLYHGITRSGENGVFVTFEERPADIAKNVRGFGWDFSRLARDKRLAFVDAAAGGEDGAAESVSGRYDLAPLLLRITDAVRRVGARRLAVDSMGTLYSRFEDKGAVRSLLFRLQDALKALRVTTLISAEAADGAAPAAPRGIEEFVADAALTLSMRQGQQQVTREIFVNKMRGTGYRSGRVEYSIGDSGIEVYPKIPVDRDVSLVDFDRRRPFGVEGLDSSMGGGLPTGQICMLSGNTGTGKTTLCQHFLNEGLRRGEGGVYVAMEEHIDEVRARGRLHGFRFESHERAGRLAFVSPESLIDVSNDKLLARIVDAVTRLKARRLVLDSISSLMSATESEEGVRQFLIQLSGFCKSRGVTSVLSYLNSHGFGAEKGQLLGSTETNLMRLSSIVDAILLLRYVEREQSVKKVLNVLKLRGSDHRKDLFEYEIDGRGFRMGARFTAAP